MTTQVNKQSLGASDILMLYWFLLQLLSYLIWPCQKTMLLIIATCQVKLLGWCVCSLGTETYSYYISFLSMVRVQPYEIKSRNEKLED